MRRINTDRFSEYRSQDLDYVDFAEREERQAKRGDKLRELEMERNTMSDTPRTDAETGQYKAAEMYPAGYVPAEFARQLERELNDARRIQTHPDKAAPPVGL